MDEKSGGIKRARSGDAANSLAAAERPDGAEFGRRRAGRPCCCTTGAHGGIEASPQAAVARTKVIAALPWLRGAAAGAPARGVYAEDLADDRAEVQHLAPRRAALCGFPTLPDPTVLAQALFAEVYGLAEAADGSAASMESLVASAPDPPDRSRADPLLWAHAMAPEPRVVPTVWLDPDVVLNLMGVGARSRPLSGRRHG